MEHYKYLEDTFKEFLVYEEDNFIYLLSARKNILIEECKDQFVIWNIEYNDIDIIKLVEELFLIKSNILFPFITDERILSIIKTLYNITKVDLKNLDNYPDKFGSYRISKLNNGLLKFKPLTLDNINMLKESLSNFYTTICDYTVGGIMMWREFSNKEFVIYDNFLIIKDEFYDKVSFQFPIYINGDNYDLTHLYNTILAIKKYCDYNKIPLIFCELPEEYLRILKNIGLEGSTYAETDWADYIYDFDSIYSLKGRKYHKIRNHINRFYDNNNHYYKENITMDNIGKLIDFTNSFKDTDKYKNNEIAREELDKTIEVLENYELYSNNNFFGIILYYDRDKIAGYSIGEINHLSNTVFVHIEKADHKISGASQMLTHSFLMHSMSLTCDDIKYVNREEDTGDEGLRQAKLAYFPLERKNKYIFEVNKFIFDI